MYQVRPRFLFLPALMALALLLIAVSGTPALAQNPNPDITRTELRNLDRFLDSHPEIARDLRQNPRLIDDRAYVNAHPQLREFLEHHPNTREELRETPNYFMARERAFDRREGDRDNDITRTEVRNFDEYLDKHPNQARDIRNNPRLVDDPQYLAKHPELKEWLDHHPNTREELRETPKAFMARARGFEKKENKHKKNDHDRDDRRKGFRR